MKRFTAVLLAICLALVSVPTAIAPVSAADGDYFIFPGEQSDFENARVVLTNTIDLTGTINQVIGSTISYTVERVVKSKGVEQVVQSNPNQTANIILNGNSIRILSIQLFPGVNKITFKGLNGFTEVSSSIYIEYRNSPSLYDLKAIIDGQQFDILEDRTTVIHSALSRYKPNYDIIITGKAPNADRVTVIVNGRSYTYTVSSINGWTFAASPVNVKKGKNTVTIRVFNGTQSVETTREIVFYNGEVTYYDLQLTTDPNNDVGVSLESAPNYSVKSGEPVNVTGKVILPVKVTQQDVNGTIVTNYSPDDRDFGSPNSKYQYRLDTLGWGNLTLTSPDPDPPAFTPATQFVTVQFEQKIGEVGNDLSFDTLHTLEFRGENAMKNAPANIDTTGRFAFYLRESNKPYIHEVNYLPGYSDATDTTQLPGMSGSPLNGATIPALPLGVELLIGNPPSGSEEAGVDLIEVRNSQGTLSTDFDYERIKMSPPVYVTRTVDGVERQFQRVFLRIDKLPASGTMTLKFQVASGSTAEARIQLLYGPYVKYDLLYDGMEVPYNTTDSNGKDYLLNQVFSYFRGELKNVSNTGDIRYSNDPGPPAKLQTVFMYINNIEVKLTQENATGPVTRFMLDTSDSTNLNKAFDAIFKGGENVVKFVFLTPNNSYVNETKFVIIPTNLPEIPAKNTDGVFPYSVNRTEPMKNDPNFELRGTVYTTREARMNIFGTFDFIDLGNTASLVELELSLLGSNAQNYILHIQTGDEVYEWNLGQKFQSKDGKDVFNRNSSESPISVAYDYDKESFEFILANQVVPPDGSPKVYTITVFNSGKNGPRATYRLEIDPTTIPYTILAPVSEKRTINQSFVEVLIYSEGAQSVVIDGKPAKKVRYIDYSKSPEEELDAFYGLVTGLKANKPTNIKFVITSGSEKIQDTLTVTYTPENIPGAQVMETMKNKHTPFGNALTLSFERGTNLIRRDYNVPQEYKTQVYNGNNILFAIANPTDGVVDRHEFESVPAGYDLNVELGSVYFSASFPKRFVKVSPVFWIDAGQADDIATSHYDPITSGYDPLPFSKIKDESREYYFQRNPERELIPSKRGTLTLGYDPSARQSAGVTITVFRFDPFTRQWENIGGTVDEKKNTITVPFDRFGYYVVGKLSAGYNDIIDHPYARNAVEAVFAKGVMNAIDPSGAFGTDQYVTRGEFTRMIVRALELPLNYDGPKHFMDIGDTGGVVSPDALWDYRYIETAARAGIVKGTRPETFEPTNYISRQDAAVMLANALNLKQDTNYDNIRKQLQKAFKDEASISVYAKPAIAAIQKKGFITGAPVDANDLSKGYVFEPTARLLRSDAAIIIARVMADQKKLPKIFAPQQ
ncbi:putative S-layer protein [Thermobacillus composti KWC4]|uniref:Putative S-layer protein n=1 Tax=Thermobacillus composti (strain DSM 18247 / JCM 13945 / KWC4) TaxID=717605 RepID=L0EK08_THECK|nr:S-layer homology domain-containing protein [Thermobacillus composti]AGA59837.1 putative S-layer protein [Thermobacillus composti KWC4]